MGTQNNHKDSRYAVQSAMFGGDCCEASSLTFDLRDRDTGIIYNAEIFDTDDAENVFIRAWNTNRGEIDFNTVLCYEVEDWLGTEDERADFVYDMPNCIRVGG